MFSFKSPGKAANPYLDRINQETQQTMQPYSQMSNIGAGLQNQYTNMANDPVANIQNIRAQYQQTPGHKLALEDALRMSNNAAVAGGMIGTPMGQRQNMETAAGVNDQYERQWVQQALNQQQMGLQGQQGLFNQSMGANQYLADQNANVNMSRGNLAVADRQGRNNRRQDIMKFLLDGAGSGIGSLAGLAGSALGGAFGGPVGATAGQALGNSAYKYFFPNSGA